MATYVLTIGGVVQRWTMHSLQITETQNARNTLRLGVVSTNGSYRPALDSDIVITEDGVRIFGGTIDRAAEAGVGGVGLPPIVTTITASDYSGLAERQHVATTVPAGSLKAFLTAMLAYLPGVTLDPTQADGPALPAVPYAYDKVVRDALGEACALAAAGYLWEIDYNKVLRAFQAGTRAAPFDIAAGDGHLIGDVTVDPQRTAGQYCNRVIVQIGSGTARTHQAWTADGVARQWTTDFPATNDWPGVVMHNGVNLALGPYEPGTPASGYAVQWDAVTHTIYQRTGDAPFPAGDAIAIDYIAQYPVSVVVDNATEQAARGIWDMVVAQPDVWTRADAIAYGQAYLTTGTVVAKRVQYQTDDLGLHPGQVQYLNLPTRGLSAVFLITDVQITNTLDRSLRRTVTALEGTAFQSPPADVLFRQWSGIGGTAAAAVLPAPATGGPTGGGGGTGRTSYFLGGSGLEAKRTATAGAWVPATGGAAIGQGAIQIQIDTTTRGSTVATVTARLRVATAGPSVVARLYNVTDGIAAPGTSAPVTGTAWQTVVFTVTLTAGAKFYELQLQPSVANADVFGVAYVE